MNAACESWVDVLMQLVSHCPKGPDTLVDALQLHITCCKLQMGTDSKCESALPSVSAAAGATAAAMPAAAAAGAPGSLQQQQQQRAAVARVCVQAWAFVCQWVMQARPSSSQAALTRLAALAQSLACVSEVPEWLEAVGPLNPEGSSPEAATATVAARGTTGGAVSSSRDGSLRAAAAAGEGVGFERSSSDAGASDHSAALGSRTSAAGAAAAAAATAADEDAAYKGVPPPEPSSEPSALAALWAAEGRPAVPAAAGGGLGPGGGYSAEVAAAAAVFAAAEAVCWPQAFLLGRALLPQVSGLLMSACCAGVPLPAQPAYAAPV